MMGRLGLATAAALLAILVGGSLLNSSCQSPPGSPPKTQPPPGSTKGVPSLVQEVVFVQEPDSAKAVRMIEAGELQVYAQGITDPELVRRIKASPLMGHETSYGSTTELSFNPVGPTFPQTGKLNPFSIPAIREAMNRLVDRRHIAEEIYGGMAVPRYFPLNNSFPDYARLAPNARALEIQYAPNPAKAKETITQEMKKLGAVLVDGKWRYQGQPVQVIFLIRTEDKRRDVGDYVATLLEGIGFVVDRQYKTAAEASPIWIGSDPAAGRWHIYTGGWISTVVSRDQGSNFNFYYTPRGRTEPLWQAYRPTEKFGSVADTLARGDYRTLEERQQLMAEALKLSIEDSVRVWLVDAINVWPHRAEVALTADLAGGVSGSWLWPYTLRYTDREGGRITFGSPSILTEPWNPVAGTNWVFDIMVMRGTGDSALLPDPFTGLLWPNRIKSAEVYVQEGLPVVKTHDWLTLSFLPSIQVPKDAWIDWDPKAQRFITVGEKHPEGLPAKTKTVIRYADDLFQKRWHDGTRLSLADMVFGLILTFDRPNKESAIFDEAEVPAFETFLRYFRGARIVQEDPLIAEVYSDLIFPDAEWIADSRAGYFYTTVPWHMVAVGVMAEANSELAFSSNKADRLKVEWMNYIAGPSLPVLERYRLKAQEEGFIPYPNAFGKYVGAEEARARYRALGEWRQQKGHFWVGQGPFYVESVHTVLKNIVLRRFEDVKANERWLAFTEPRIAQLKVSGPTRVTVGTQAEFLVEATFKDKPYPVGDVDFVKFLVFDAQGMLSTTRDAETVRDGVWRARLTPEETARLGVGSSRLEVVMVSRAVSIPSFESLTFVTLDR
ncbi:MAG: ABC transporter substrate-binding protein [Chloroflexota bacterium]|nr:ABC transporter substrate-binding protein [Chloroflexota bacterium]